MMDHAGVATIMIFYPHVLKVGGGVRSSMDVQAARLST
jgi:hypothetical protein